MNKYLAKLQDHLVVCRKCRSIHGGLSIRCERAHRLHAQAIKNGRSTHEQVKEVLVVADTLRCLTNDDIYVHTVPFPDYHHPDVNGVE